MIRFEEITNKNIWKVCMLEPFDEQKDFVAENIQSLAEAYATRNEGNNAMPLAVYDDETLIGFVMIGKGTVGNEDESDLIKENYSLWRLMIDKRYQGKGLGKQTIDAVMDLIRSFPFGEAKKVWLSYEPENTRAREIYQKYGFVENGEMCGNEIVAVIDIGEKMTQEQRLDFLVEEFKADSHEYKDLQVPDDTDGKRRILRSLMNVRMPGEMDDAVLSVQDEYLQERIREKGIVRLQDIPVKRGCLSIWQSDITRLAVDAIVNAANSQMLGCFIPMHHCIDNCIHTFAGVQLRLECSRQMNQLRSKYGRDYEQPTAVPMLTDAYNLPSKKIVHIVGPILQYELTSELENDLADCYRNTLDLCLEHGLKSVAFCCISTGVFHFPNKRAAEIAVSTVDSWLSEHPGAMERVVFNVFKDEDREYYESILR